MAGPVHALAQILRPAKEALSIAGFSIGWYAVRHLPERTAYLAFETLADVLVRRGGKGVERLRSNYARVRPELSDRELDQLVKEGMRSYMRYFCETFRLNDVTSEQLADIVRTSGDGPIRELLAEGRSVVVFIAHMGNWDLAGAWSTQHLAPVTTVAERLEPEEVF
ncbi:MAG: phosphatidylinositol mannoside acyltransferase, partial [Dermatophilaceae bacterium]